MISLKCELRRWGVIALTRNTPWGNDLDVRLEAVEGQLESDLVVTLSGAAVGDVLAAELSGGLHHGSCNDWASERGSEEVDVLTSQGGEIRAV